MTSTTQRYRAAASQSAGTVEKIADFWTQGSQRLSDYMLPSQRLGSRFASSAMVSLLWDAGLIDAAVELEVLWNELGVQYPFSLLCAYSAQPAAYAHQLDALTEVCHAHTQVTGAPPEAA